MVPDAELQSHRVENNTSKKMPSLFIASPFGSVCEGIFIDFIIKTVADLVLFTIYLLYQPYGIDIGFI